MSIDPEAARDLLLPTRAPSGVLRRSIHESDSEGLYLDRVDDRGCDHRHSGRSSTPGVPGLQQPGEDIRSDLGCERMPHLDHRGLSKCHQRAWRQQLGLRSHKRRVGRGLEVGINGTVVTLVPLKAQAGGGAPIPMTTVDVGGNTVFGWRCGNAAVDLTTLNPKFLPGSCRG